MRAFTTSYIGQERSHLLTNRIALVALQLQAVRDGLSIVRVELTSEEATALIMELGERDLDEWVRFGTILSIPFVVVKAEEPCYAI